MNEALAAAFHRRARLSRTDLGVDGPALRPSSAPEHVDIAVPGFVGTEYGPGGLCLVSVNPAGGKDAYSPTPGDKMIYDAAAGFIEAASDEVEAAFQALGRAFVSAMPAWGSQWRHVSAIIDAANAPLNAITYVYLVPFRTREDKGSRLPVDVQQKGVRHGFYDVLDAVRPGLLIAMDGPSKRAIEGWAAKRGHNSAVIYYPRKHDDHAGRASALQGIRQASGR